MENDQVLPTTEHVCYSGQAINQLDGTNSNIEQSGRTNTLASSRETLKIQRSVSGTSEGAGETMDDINSKTINLHQEVQNSIDLNIDSCNKDINRSNGNVV
ncbi:unnamed protein product [Rotaria sp. Silwood2]|nr:unnamed protein product [Rotaria sp. Silwood2]